MRQTINIASGTFAAALATYLAAYFDNEISKISNAPDLIMIFSPFMNFILFLIYGFRSVIGIIIGLSAYNDVQIAALFLSQDQPPLSLFCILLMTSIWACKTYLLFMRVN